MRTKRLKISYTRGDGDSIVFYRDGDWSGYKLRFAINESDKLTAVRLATKSSANNGGSDSEISAVYDTGKERTKFVITLIPEDTETKNADVYFYSLTATDVLDEDKHYTLFAGEFALLPEGENDLNGLPLDDETARYVLVDTKDFEDETLLLFRKDEKGFIPIRLSDISPGEIFEKEIDLFNIEGVTPNTDRLRAVVGQLVADVLEQSGLISTNESKITVLQVESDTREAADAEVDFFNLNGVTPTTDGLRRTVESNYTEIVTELTAKQTQIDEINLTQNEIDLFNFIGE